MIPTASQPNDLCARVVGAGPNGWMEHWRNTLRDSIAAREPGMMLPSLRQLKSRNLGPLQMARAACRAVNALELARTSACEPALRSSRVHVFDVQILGVVSPINNGQSFIVKSLIFSS